MLKQAAYYGDGLVIGKLCLALLLDTKLNSEFFYYLKQPLQPLASAAHEP